MTNNKKDVYFFIPLASIGGTESVHLDVMKALCDFRLKIYVRYSSNVWKGRASSQTPEALIEGKTMLPEFDKYGKVTFVDRYLEASRFGKLIRKYFIRKLAKKINRSVKPVVIFWHRESIEFILDYLEPHVKIIDIVHNNSNDTISDAAYLVNDLVPRIDKRVLVSEGLMKWLNPLYKKENYNLAFLNRITTINHCVSFPKQGKICKDKQKFNILYVGRDSHEKRFPFVLEIGEQLIAEGLPIELHIIGPDPSNYQNFNKPGFHWYGQLKNRFEIEEIYKKAHVLLMTSSSEGFPKVIAEAMAFSCVPITTSVGDISNHIIHDLNGILSDTENCINESLAAIKILQSDNEALKRLSENCYLYAKEKFGEERFKNDWTNVIESIG